MRLRDHIALTLPSFLLRLVLAVTFLWAGTGKLIGTTQVSGDAAARLANLGVPFLPDAPPSSSSTDPDTGPDTGPDTDREATTPDEPVNPLPDTVPDGLQDNLPQLNQNQNQDQLQVTQDLINDINTTLDEQIENNSAPNQQSQAHHLPALINVVQTSSPAVGSDFPDPVNIKRVYGLALLLDKSASPGLTEDSQPKTPTLPTWLAKGKMPIYAAWAAAITELTAAFLLLIGLFTRLSALSICGVMVVAAWTTNIGPAALQSTDALLGFIPSFDDPWDPSSYAKLLWQSALIVMSLSVALLGAGPLSLDRLIFKPSRRDPYVSGGTESASKQVHKHKPDPQAAPQDRSSFDRTPPPQNNPTP
ncbi:MAG: DoxX family protein [Phycisphaerales bacterium]